MGVIKLIELISSSPQGKDLGAENLLYNHRKKPWLCSPLESRQIEAEFKLCESSQINFIDIGNNGSSTFEVQVGRSSNPPVYVTLLPAVTIMSMADIKEEKKRDSVVMFNLSNMVQDVAAQKWDRVKIICSQPYTKKFPFGLQFLVLRTKNTWEIDGEVQDLFEMEARYFSKTSEKTCTEPVIYPKKVLSRGQRLVQASKAQHSPTIKKISENEANFKEDILVFLIAYSEEIKGKIPLCEDSLSDFEKLKRRKLSLKEKLLFREVFLVFDFYPSTDDVYLHKRPNVITIVNETSEVIKPNRTKISANAFKSDSSEKLTLNSRKPFPGLAPFQISNNEEKILTKRSNEAPSKRPCPTFLGSVTKKQTKLMDKFPTKSKESCFRPEDFIQSDGSQPSTSSGITYVDCPICFESFLPSAVEKHAASCGEEVSECIVVEDEVKNGICPFCAKTFPDKKLQLHTEQCFQYY